MMLNHAYGGMLQQIRDNYAHNCNVAMYLSIHNLPTMSKLRKHMNKNSYA